MQLQKTNTLFSQPYFHFEHIKPQHFHCITLNAASEGYQSVHGKLVSPKKGSNGLVTCSSFIYGNSGSGTLTGCRSLKLQELEQGAGAEACMVTWQLGGPEFLTVADVAETLVLAVVAAMGSSTAAYAVVVGAAGIQFPAVAGAVACTSHAIFELAGGRLFKSSKPSSLMSANIYRRCLQKVPLLSTLLFFSGRTCCSYMRLVLMPWLWHRHGTASCQAMSKGT